MLPALASRGIDVQYTDDVAGTLNFARTGSSQFDGLIVYANIDEIIRRLRPTALLDLRQRTVAGLFPLHCASFCFRNNDDVVALIGAQFIASWYWRVYRCALPTHATTHPIMQGYNSFESWDETYVHAKHNMN